MHNSVVLLLYARYQWMGLWGGNTSDLPFYGGYGGTICIIVNIQHYNTIEIIKCDLKVCAIIIVKVIRSPIKNHIQLILIVTSLMEIGEFCSLRTLFSRYWQSQAPHRCIENVFMTLIKCRIKWYGLKRMC
jgi:hypothetical protein